jgi:peptidyl-prolyl cis-trans isomerase D
MLKTMRKHAKYFYVLFVLVILTFIFWGVGRIDQPTSVPVAVIGEEVITVQEYWNAYQRTMDLYRDIYKEEFDEEKFNLKKEVLDSLVADGVLYVAAMQAGITVSDAELQEAITNEPAFMRDGAFNRQVYLRSLELNRITPSYYEEAKRRDLMREKMKRLVEGSVDLTPSDLEKVKGDETLRQILLESKRQAALASFIEGLKKQMRITVNEQLVS